MCVVKEKYSHVKILVQLREVGVAGNISYAVEASIYGIGFVKTIEYVKDIETKDEAQTIYETMVDYYNL